MKRFIKALNSPFKRPKLKWYFGEVAVGIPSFFISFIQFLFALVIMILLQISVIITGYFLTIILECF